MGLLSLRKATPLGADPSQRGMRAAVPHCGKTLLDSLLEGTGFEPVWGFSCQVVFWLVGGSLFGARKSFFVPSPAIRFAERAEGVKGPKR